MTVTCESKPHINPAPPPTFQELSPPLSIISLSLSLIFYEQIETLEAELEEVTERHEQLKRELEEGSQDPGVKLVASQVAEYKKLKNDAEKKSASLKQRLDRVSAVELYLCKIKNMCVWNLVYSLLIFFSLLGWRASKILLRVYR